MNVNQNESILKFTNPKLKETIFKINNDTKNDVKMSMSLIVTHSEVILENNYKKCEINLTLTNFKKDDDIFEGPFKLKVTMGANFKWPVETDEVISNNFIKINAPSMLLAYIRPFVSQLTGLTDIGVQQIPFIDFTRNIEE